MSARSKVQRDSGMQRCSRRRAIGLLGAGLAASGLGLLPGCEAPPAVRPVPPPAPPPTSKRVWPPRASYPAPDLADACVLRQDVGIRPYRRGAVRVERDAHAIKPLIHQYGHGGAGITLAPASASDAADLLSEAEVAPPSPIAILGAGIVGMTTADLLLDRGYRVTIYTDRMTPDTTSDIAGGQFAPATVAVGGAERLTRWMRLASDYYLPRAGRGCGVERVVNFTAGGGRALRLLPDDRFSSQALTRLPIAGLEQPGSAHETLLITPPVYLPWLVGRLRERGCAFSFRRFDSASQVAALPDTAVINCLGMGSKPLYSDSRLVPIRGRLVLLKPQRLDYLFSHRNGYLFSRSDAVVLGGTYDRGTTDTTPDPRATQRILERHRRFFGSA